MDNVARAESEAVQNCLLTGCHLCGSVGAWVRDDEVEQVLDKMPFPIPPGTPHLNGKVERAQ
jgi:hypothetical protein